MNGGGHQDDRSDRKARQEIKFGPDGLVPAIAQQHDSREVLMMAWMNRDAGPRQLAEGRACCWSRSRATLWRKRRDLRPSPISPRAAPRLRRPPCCCWSIRGCGVPHRPVRQLSFEPGGTTPSRSSPNRTYRRTYSTRKVDRENGKVRYRIGAQFGRAWICATRSELNGRPAQRWLYSPTLAL